MKKFPQAFLLLSAVLLLPLTVIRLVQSWKYDSHLDHVAGVWIALALDLKRGLFYRAPYGPSGYGGTRFFPLYFSLHAAAMKIAGWRAAGYFLSTVSIVLLLGGIYYLLRRMGSARWLASAGVLAALAGSSVQDSLLGIREDGMAAMLSVWGVALCVNQPSRRRLFAAAVLFALAFATKESAIAAAAAVFAMLLLSKRFRLAWQFAGATAAGYACVLLAMYVASAGRAFAAFQYTIATGSNWQSLLYSPISMEQAMHGYVAEVVLLVLGTAAFVAAGARGILHLPWLWFLCTLGVTLVIFSSDGTAGNHLIELHIAAIVMFITWISDLQMQDAGVAALAAACLLAWMELLVQHRDVDAIPVRAQLQQIVQKIGATDKPILADNPMVPITAGQQPYLLDAFMFRAISENVPGFSDPMWQMLRNRQFEAVVLVDNPDSDEGRDTYTNFHFGEDFIPLMERQYQAAGSVGEHFLFLPR